MPVKAIKLETFAQRAVLLVPGVFLLAGAFFCVKWGLAHTASSKAEFKEVADLTVEMAPNDPQTHYAAAVLHEKTFLPEDLDVSLSEFEKAAALAPRNYLLWLELGNARGRSGDEAGSERALRKALEIAPNYAQVQWALGNALLRQGRTEEAFALIRQATVGDDKYTSPAAVTAWQAFDGDLAQVRQAVGDSPRISAALAVFLAGSKRLDEAFATWDVLPAEEKRTVWRTNAEVLYGQLIEAKKYRDAARVYSEALAGEGEGPVPGQLTNGGFETAIKPTGASAFEWQIADGQQPQVSPDAGQRHAGSRSLVMIFNSSYVKEFRPVSQMAVVEPGRAYTFGLFYKAELTTAATFYWEIVDPIGGKVLASTDPVGQNSDWRDQRVRFTVPGNTEAVVVRLARVPCGTVLCPVAGRIWFDDISISAG